MLDDDTLSHLRKIKDDIEEILAEVGDILPPEFRMTCILRYCGDNPEVTNMIWTDDVHEDVIGALKKEQERYES